MGIERLEERLVLSGYSVTSFTDSVDAIPGDGIAADSAGRATLRAAVIDANALPGADTITLGAGVFTMSLGTRGENAAATGDLDVTGTLTIEGAGAGTTILDAAQLDRFFHVLPNATLTLRNLTIRNGRESNGGAIENNGTLTLENVELTSNSSTARGGAIYNSTGRLTLQSVKVIGNSTGDVSSGVGTAIGGGLASFGGTVTIISSQFANNSASGDGGGIDSRSTVLQITNSTFQNNFANVGGAVRLFNGSALLTNNSFSGDHATATGGAISSNICALTIDGGAFTANYLSPLAGTRTGGSINLVGVNASSPAVTITGVTFTNTGSGDGGAIYNSNVRLNLSNSTFDRVTGRQGGAIMNTAGGTLVVVNTTIVGGTGVLGGAIYNTATLQMSNSTIVGNTSTGQATALSAAVAHTGTGSFTSLNNLIAGNANGADVMGAFISLGGNLIGNGAGATGFTQPTDQVGTASVPIDPMLLPLADHGGRVPTMAFSPLSPARDAGVAGGPATDARGLPRGNDPADIGAYEYQNHLPAAGPFNVTSTEDENFTGRLIAVDADGDALTFELLVQPTAGTIILQLDGHFVYIPPANLFGSVGFRYRATDGRGHSNEVDAEITVSPVNDAPSVTDQSFTVQENSPIGTVVGSLVAEDIDSTVLIGEIVSGNEDGAFYLDPQTGELVVADGSRLNFEANSSYTFVVRVTDNGVPAKFDEATITVVLTDVNDAPMVDSASFTIDENSAVGTVVGVVTAMDVDDGQTLLYAITTGNADGAFVIDAITGQISVASAVALDFEAKASYSLTVTVTDSGTPGLSETAFVTIDLNNVNEAPRSSDRSFSIREKSANGSEVGGVTATDPDAGQSISYSITGGNLSGAFSIDVTTGQIKVANSAVLIFLTTPRFTLQVQVSDSGSPSLSTTSTVTVNLNAVEQPSSSVVIDVDIGDTTNTIKLGKIFSLAILSSSSFDARAIDVTRLRFGKQGTENSLQRFLGIPLFLYADVNRDGRLDLIVGVDSGDTGLKVGDTIGKLTGKLRNGQSFSATSAINVRNDNRKMPGEDRGNK